MSAGINNVKRALSETLRHDYGPERSGEYFRECNARLSVIESEITTIDQTDHESIAALLDELDEVMLWISLIERSHLGEFSWPFSEQIRRVATTLLSESSLQGEPLKPIIHIIADGEGYWIYPEGQVSGVSSNRRLMIVAFPRQLKHHVLYHSLFGHELGHTALTAIAAPTSSALNDKVIPALTSKGPMGDKEALQDWLISDSAPQEVDKTPRDYDYHSWLRELICDLFGLLLFGPGFLAAHRSFLGPYNPNPYSFSESHPPYAFRHKMLVQAMRIGGWDKTISKDSDKEIYAAENELLNYLLDDRYDAWAGVFDDAQIGDAADAIQEAFALHDSIGYKPANANSLVAQVKQIANAIPPVISKIDADGEPQSKKVDISNTLYAGWVYSLGRDHFSGSAEMDFYTINRLCDQALLQQIAIDQSKDAEAD